MDFLVTFMASYPWVSIPLCLIGIILLVKGGDWFVDAASFIAESFGIPKLIVGATIVSFATTLPELLVSAISAYQARVQNDPSLVDMSIGNAVGSVIANIALIMAIALICMPSAVRRRDYLMKSCLMLGSAIVVMVTGLIFEEISIASSIILLCIFAFAMADNILSARRSMLDTPKENRPALNRKTVSKNVVLFLVGILGIVLGAQLLVDSATVLARDMFGVPERLIAITIVAVGTSLPELVTTVTAIIKKQPSLSAGNIIGANILNLTFIMPLCSLIYGKPLPVQPAVAFLDFPVCLFVGLLALLPMLFTKRFRRWQGFALLGSYVAYVTVSCLGIVG